MSLVSKMVILHLHDFFGERVQICYAKDAKDAIPTLISLIRSSYKHLQG